MLTAAFAVLFAFLPETALRGALDASATWTMERHLAGSERVLRTSGRVDCRQGESIVWKVEKPFESTVTMTTNSMVFADEDGTRVKQLDELPHYSDLRQATDAFAAGDRKAFDGVFDVDRKLFADGGWKLVLKPEVRQMKYLFTAIELTGAALPTNVVMRNADGGWSSIRFTETKRAR